MSFPQHPEHPQHPKHPDGGEMPTAGPSEAAPEVVSEAPAVDDQGVLVRSAVTWPCPICAERARRFADEMARVLPFAWRDHDAFLHGLLAVPVASVLRIPPHAARRQVDRLIGAPELRDLVETGEPFEWFSATPTWRSIGLVGRSTTGRILHVRCQYAVTQPTAWWVQTVYDPTRGKSWWWSADGRRRVCFCPPPPGWVDDGAI